MQKRLALRRYEVIDALISDNHNILAHRQCHSDGRTGLFALKLDSKRIFVFGIRIHAKILRRKNKRRMHYANYHI